jgi:hypothetical protein
VYILSVTIGQFLLSQPETPHNRQLLKCSVLLCVVTVEKVLIKITDRTGFTVSVSTLMHSSGSVRDVSLGAVFVFSQFITLQFITQWYNSLLYKCNCFVLAVTLWAQCLLNNTMKICNTVRWIYLEIRRIPQSFITTHIAFHNSQLCGLSTATLALSFILYKYEVPFLSIKRNMHGVMWVKVLHQWHNCWWIIFCVKICVKFGNRAAMKNM